MKYWPLRKKDIKLEDIQAIYLYGKGKVKEFTQEDVRQVVRKTPDLGLRIVDAKVKTMLARFVSGRKRCDKKR